MQSRSSAPRQPVRYARPESEEPAEPRAEEEGGDGLDEQLLEVVPPLPSSLRQAPKEDALLKACRDALRSAGRTTQENSGLLAAAAGALTAAATLAVLLARRRGSNSSGQSGPGPAAKLRPSASCVPLADGSGCVVRRVIAADNSCLFNAVGHAMHHSLNRAPHLRNVVAREVAGDPQQWNAAFLNMSNEAYCQWITNPVNWGGGIELRILATHYQREISAWNIETGQEHVFGEDGGFKRRVMVIYNGVHYDALAVAAHPRAPPEEDVTEFNPRTKRGKMILAAAKKLVQLTHVGDKYVSKNKGKNKQQQQQQAEQAAAAAAAAQQAAATSSSSGSGAPLRCEDCGVQCADEAAAGRHAAASGHKSFAQVAAGDAGAPRSGSRGASSTHGSASSSSSSPATGAGSRARSQRPGSRKTQQAPAGQEQSQQQEGSQPPAAAVAVA